MQEPPSAEIQQGFWTKRAVCGEVVDWISCEWGVMFVRVVCQACYFCNEITTKITVCNKIGEIPKCSLLVVLVSSIVLHVMLDK